MKKRYILFLVIALALVGGLPYLYGYFIKEKFNETIGLMNNVDNMTTTLEDYQMGWRQSTAKTSMTLHFPESDQDEITLRFQHDIQHGPIFQSMNRKGSKWHLAEGMVHSKLVDLDERFVAKTDLKDQNVLDFSMLVALDGSIDVSLNGDQFQLKEVDNSKLNWKGIGGDFTLSRALDRANGELIMPGVGFEAEDANFHFEDIVVKFDRFLGQTPFHDLWLGNGTINAHRIQAESKTDDVDLGSLALTEVVIGSVIEPEDAYLRMSATMSVNDIKVTEQNYGPLSYTVQVRKVSPEGLRLVDTLNQEAKQMPTMGSFVFMKRMGDLANLFLTPRPEADIKNLNLKTPHGKLTGNVHVEIGGEDANNIEAPQVILDSLSGQAQLVMPQPLFKQILGVYFAVPTNPTDEQKAEIEGVLDKIVAQLLKEHWVAADKEQYSMNFEFKGAEVTLNGKQFSMQNMQSILQNAVLASKTSEATQKAAPVMPQIPENLN